MDRQSTIATYAGILIAGIGFLIIALAWNGAASVDYFPAQFPFLISGGMTGIGLIIVGVSIMIIQTVRRDGREQQEQIERLTAGIAELRTRLSVPDEFDPTTTGEYRPRPRRAAGNGQGAKDADATTEIPPVPAGSQREDASSGSWQKPS